MMIRVLLAALAMAALTAVPALAADFDHKTHDSYLENPDCTLCHVADAESIVPERSICLECHEQEFAEQVQLPALKTHGPVWALNHGPYAKSGRADCSSCHQQNECLECHAAGSADEQDDFGNNMINVHSADFRFTHPIAGRSGQQVCTGCHEVQFCNDCHNQFAPADLAVESHRRGWSNISIAGTGHDQFGPETCQTCHKDSVLPSHDWSRNHAHEARKDLASCQACHPEGNICLGCHSATTGLGINPHPRDWDDYASRLKKASDGKSCRKCH